MAQKEYKRRYDLVGKKIHWEMYRKFGMEVSNKWYQHEPETVVENEKSTILWDMNIKTGDVIDACRPDMAVIAKDPMTAEWNKKNKERKKVSGPSDRAEKDLEYEGNSNTAALGSTPKNVKKRLHDLGIDNMIVEL